MSVNLSVCPERYPSGSCLGCDHDKPAEPIVNEAVSAFSEINKVNLLEIAVKCGGFACQNFELGCQPIAAKGYFINENGEVIGRLYMDDQGVRTMREFTPYVTAEEARVDLVAWAQR
jgi:hypothetical protein